MALYFVPGRRSIAPLEEIEALADLAFSRARGLDYQNPASVADLTAIVDELVTAYAIAGKRPVDDANTLKTQVISHMLGKLSAVLSDRSMVKVQMAQTALEESAKIRGEEGPIFRSFRPTVEPLGSVPASLFAQAVRGLGSLACSLGAPRAFDGWYAREVTRTVEGKRDDSIHGAGIRARPFMMPFHKIRSLTPSDQENLLLQGVLSDTRQGIDDALQSILRILTRGNDVVDVSAPAVFGLPAQVLKLVDGLGAQLHGFSQYVDRGRDSPAEEHPELKKCLGEIHQRYLEWSDPSAAGSYPESFHALTAVEQSRNVPAMFGALYGLWEANRVVVEVLKSGVLMKDGAPREEGSDLQLHLLSSASHAVRKEFREANEIFSRAVADETSLILAHRHLLVQSDKPLERLAQIHELIFGAVLEAGAAFDGGRGVGDAPFVARRTLGPLQAIFEPEGGRDASELQAKAEDVIRRARLEDLAKVCTKFFHVSELPAGEALIQALLERVDQRDFFRDRLTALPQRAAQESPVESLQTTPLDDDELKILCDALYCANATWKVGQVHRVRASRDFSRIDPFSRDRVFNPYDLCVTAASDNVMSLWVMAKDLFVLKETLETMPM